MGLGFRVKNSGLLKEFSRWGVTGRVPLHNAYMQTERGIWAFFRRASGGKLPT